MGNKADESAYPVNDESYYYGLTKKEKLAMEIYAREVDTAATETTQEIIAIRSLRAADIFFEQLNK